MRVVTATIEGTPKVLIIAQNLGRDDAIAYRRRVATQYAGALEVWLEEEPIRLDPNTGERDVPAVTARAILEAWEETDEDNDDFATAWDEFLAGRDTPCPNHDDGIHSYRMRDGRCYYCSKPKPEAQP